MIQQDATVLKLLFQRLYAKHYVFIALNMRYSYTILLRKNVIDQIGLFTIVTDNKRIIILKTTNHLKMATT